MRPYAFWCAPQTRGRLAELQAVVDDKSLAEARLEIAHEQLFDDANVLQHDMAAVAVPEG